MHVKCTEKWRNFHRINRVWWQSWSPVMSKWWGKWPKRWLRSKTPFLSAIGKLHKTINISWKVRRWQKNKVLIRYCISWKTLPFRWRKVSAKAKAKKWLNWPNFWGNAISNSLKLCYANPESPSPACASTKNANTRLWRAKTANVSAAEWPTNSATTSIWAE